MQCSIITATSVRYIRADNMNNPISTPMRSYYLKTAPVSELSDAELGEAILVCNNAKRALTATDDETKARRYELTDRIDALFVERNRRAEECKAKDA